MYRQLRLFARLGPYANTHVPLPRKPQLKEHHTRKGPIIAMTGLDYAGKTQCLYHLRNPLEEITTIPTVGMNNERVVVERVAFSIWDIAGRSIFKRLIQSYTAYADALLFVADLNEPQRFNDPHDPCYRAVDWLRDTLPKLKPGAPVVLVGNKLDLVRARGAPADLMELAETFGLPEIQDRAWHVCAGHCKGAREENGMYKALHWLVRLYRGQLR